MNIKAKVGAAALAAVLSLLAVQEGDGPTVATPSGVVHKAYVDDVGVLTICHGHTANVKLKDTATANQCKQWMLEDLEVADAAVTRYVNVDLTDYQRTALWSFIYNVGTGNFRSSTMLRHINQGKFCLAAKEFPRWNKGGGKVLRGLTNRRYIEQELFLRGYSCG